MDAMKASTSPKLYLIMAPSQPSPQHKPSTSQHPQLVQLPKEPLALQPSLPKQQQLSSPQQQQEQQQQPRYQIIQQGHMSQSQGKDMWEKNYEGWSHVGSGAHGQVFKAREKNKNGTVVAIKQILIRRQAHYFEAGMPMAAIREIALLKQLGNKDHPNIVKLMDVHHRATSDRDISLSLVFEFIDQDLSSYLERCPPPGLGPDRIRDLMIQMVNGVDFLHSNRIVHRDLKPQNILVTHDGIVKLADFGLARVYASEMKLTSVVVTLWYRAPEVLLTGQYTTAVDMWSCGCIFAELYIKQPLFKGTSEGDQLRKIFEVIGLPDSWPESAVLMRGTFKPTKPLAIDHIVPEIESEAKDLLEKMLVYSPENRVHARAALEHPYFRDDLDSVRTSSSLSMSETDSISDSRSNTPLSK